MANIGFNVCGTDGVLVGDNDQHIDWHAGQPGFEPTYCPLDGSHLVEDDYWDPKRLERYFIWDCGHELLRILVDDANS